MKQERVRSISARNELAARYPRHLWPNIAEFQAPDSELFLNKKPDEGNDDTGSIESEEEDEMTVDENEEASVDEIHSHSHSATQRGNLDAKQLAIPLSRADLRLTAPYVRGYLLKDKLWCMSLFHGIARFPMLIDC